MKLSENAARGRKIVSSVSVICSVISALSLLTLNIIGGAMGLGSAHFLKKGSISAKEMCMILRVADIPVLAAMLVVFHSFEGENAFKICLLLAVLIGTFDIVILITLTSADANAYFLEMYERQKAEQARQAEQVRHTDMSDMLVQTELTALAGQGAVSEFVGQPFPPEFTGQAAPQEFTGQAAPQEFIGQAAPHGASEQAVPSDFSGSAISYEQFRKSIMSGSAEDESMVPISISDEDKLL